MLAEDDEEKLAEEEETTAEEGGLYRHRTRKRTQVLPHDESDDGHIIQHLEFLE